MAFRILKRVFGYTNVRYRSLKKNHEWLLEPFAWLTSINTASVGHALGA
jgi:hypothetical protein